MSNRRALLRSPANLSANVRTALVLAAAAAVFYVAVIADHLP